MSPRPRRWVISDTHFFHKNILGHSGRPFATVDAMNREMVERWNAVVGREDVVFHLGDVAMWNATAYNIVRTLHGTKHLILGNHDTQSPMVYAQVGFSKILSSYEGTGYVMTHVPVHADQLQRWGVNIHGHTHQELVGHMKPLGDADLHCRVFEPDRRYRNVCVEQTDYTPVLLSEVLA